MLRTLPWAERSRSLIEHRRRPHSTTLSHDGADPPAYLLRLPVRSAASP